MQTGQNTNPKNANVTKCKYDIMQQDKMKMRRNANVARCK